MLSGRSGHASQREAFAPLFTLAAGLAIAGRAQGATLKELAKSYNVGVATISRFSR